MPTIYEYMLEIEKMQHKYAVFNNYKTASDYLGEQDERFFGPIIVQREDDGNIAVIFAGDILIRYFSDDTCRVYAEKYHNHLSLNRAKNHLNTLTPGAFIRRGKYLVLHSTDYGLTPKRKMTCRLCKGNGIMPQSLNSRPCVRCQGQGFRMVGANPKGVRVKDGMRIAPTGNFIGDGVWPDDFPREAFKILSGEYSKS